MEVLVIENLSFVEIEYLIFEDIFDIRFIWDEFIEILIERIFDENGYDYVEGIC